MPLISSLLRQAPRHPLSLRLHVPPPHLSAVLGRHIRPASSAALAIRNQKSSPLYPATINIYRSGTPATLSVGLTRMFTLVIFLVGTTIYAPGFYFSPEHSNWWIPTCIAVSATPAIAVSLLTGPMIHGIRVTLPDHVRRGGKDGLRRWSAERRGKENLPIELQFMRWAPWPKTRNLEFGELRRLRPSLKAGIANLQHVPREEVGNDPMAAKREDHRLLAGFMKRWTSRFYVKRDQAIDRAAVPGVWENLWYQIPFEEEGEGYGGRKEKSSDEGAAAGKGRAALLRPLVPPMKSIARP